MKTLSDKITQCSEGVDLYQPQDVKEAVKLLKEEMKLLDYDGEMKTIIQIIDEIFGEKLI